MLSELRLMKVRKDFGATTAVADLDLTVESGESVVLLGPSGCGKTTTLRMVAGFERVSGGTITIDDHIVAGPHAFIPAEEREVGVVFQSYALWPHMTVYDNIAYGLTVRRRRRPRPERADRVEAALDQVQLPKMGKRYPHELSGGQQQRVALARALVTNPKILLLDEPLSNLDTRLREDMRLQVRRLQKDLEITMIYITHDRSEALALADRVVALQDGRARQIAPPTQMYQSPRTRFVALSMGPANFARATVESSGNPATVVTIASNQRFQARSHDDHAPASGSEVVVCIRPHDIEIAPVTSADGFHCTITESVFLGDEVHYQLEVPGEPESWKVITRTTQPLAPGTEVTVTIAPASASILAEE